MYIWCSLHLVLIVLPLCPTHNFPHPHGIWYIPGISNSNSVGRAEQLFSFHFWISLILFVYSHFWGNVVAQWLRRCVANRKVAVSITARVSGFFIDIKSFRSHCGPGVHSASKRNEYQEHFLGGKGGRCIRLTTLPPYCAVVTRSGNLKFLESSGPLRACNGTALPFTHISTDLVSDGTMKRYHGCTCGLYMRARKIAKSNNLLRHVCP